MCKLRRQKNPTEARKDQESGRPISCFQSRSSNCPRLWLHGNGPSTTSLAGDWLVGWQSLVRTQSFQSFSLKGELTSHPETRGCQKNVGTGQSLRDQPTPPTLQPCWRGEQPPRSSAQGHQPSSSRPGLDSESLPLKGGYPLPRCTKFIDKREHAGVWEAGAEWFSLIVSFSLKD